MNHRIVHLERDPVRAVLRAPTFPHVREEHPLTAPEQLFERITAFVRCPHGGRWKR